MYIAKKFIIKFAISLTAGVATTVGVRLTNTIFDKCTCNKTYEQTKQSFAQ